MMCAFFLFFIILQICIVILKKTGRLSEEIMGILFAIGVIITTPGFNECFEQVYKNGIGDITRIAMHILLPCGVYQLAKTLHFLLKTLDLIEDLPEKK